MEQGTMICVFQTVAASGMRAVLACLALLVGLSSGCARAADAPVRDVVHLNRDWHFFLGDAAGAGATDYRERDWQHIHLPHSFSMPYFLG
jgi:hypothetical protein